MGSTWLYFSDNGGLVAVFSRVPTQIFACRDFISVSPVLGRVPVIGAVYKGSARI